jgi:hypothetical protein
MAEVPILTKREAFMDIHEFAEQYHVRTRKDECGEAVIQGKLWKSQPKLGRMYGHHVLEYGDGRFGVLMMFHVNNRREIGGSGKSAKWTFARQKLIQAGFTIRQDGDAEGIGLFDPENKTQSRFALKIAGCRLRRKLSPEQAQVLAVRLAVARAARKVA